MARELGDQIVTGPPVSGAGWVISSHLRAYGLSLPIWKRRCELRFPPNLTQFPLIICHIDTECPELLGQAGCRGRKRSPLCLCSQTLCRAPWPGLHQCLQERGYVLGKWQMTRSWPCVLWARCSFSFDFENEICAKRNLVSESNFLNVH